MRVVDADEYTVSDSPTSLGELQVVKSRLKKAPPPNSLRFYRERAEYTLQEVAKTLNTSHQQIQRLEKRQAVLTPEWADRIGGVLGVPGQLIAFSYAEDAYNWAAQAVSIRGTLGRDVNVIPAVEPYRVVGVRNNIAGRNAIAIEITPDALAPFDHWLIIVDGSRWERMGKSVLARQNEMHRQFIVRVRGGESYWRRIVPSAKRNYFHLEFDHKPTIYDIEVESVNEVVGFEPGLTLPSRELIEE